MRAWITGAKAMKGNMVHDVKRVKAYKGMARSSAGKAKGAAGKAKGMAGKAQRHGQVMKGKSAGKAGKIMGIFGKKKKQASAPVERTQAIMVDAAGAGSDMCMLGWLVPVKGPNRGDLFTLDPVSLIGTDEDATVVLIDQYMSVHHAEIRAEGGVWVLRDLGSTNGTFVNDKRIDKHELIDNDNVRFGQSLVKFKCF